MRAKKLEKKEKIKTIQKPAIVISQTSRSMEAKQLTSLFLIHVSDYC